MIRFFYKTGPSPMKVALLLEEAGLPYEAYPIDTLKGVQFAPAFLAINANDKLPAITDDDATAFDSNAILLHRAEWTGWFLPAGGAAGRSELLSWLMFVATDIGPYSGQAVHFRLFAPKPNDCAVNRYTREVERHDRILDKRLADRRFILGDAYTSVDMAMWGWTRMIPRALGEDGFRALPNVKRPFAEISARPAAKAEEALLTRSSGTTTPMCCATGFH